MRIENLSDLLTVIRNKKFDEYGSFNQNMQGIADVWSVIIGTKIRAHQVPILYAAAKLVRTKGGYKDDNYIDAINYLVQADEIHREDSSSVEEN
tara:strand:- start:1524 stop:1805 length:282 start_codon:yes stop_codon:yes gene_type:complete